MMDAGVLGVLADIPDAWLALAGATFGGVGLKVIEHWLNKNRLKTNDESSFRKELREDILATREELRRVDKDVDQWRDKYYRVLEALSEVILSLDKALALLKSAGIAHDIKEPPSIREVTEERE